MKIKYVGSKPDGETAFAQLSGIERWMPGDAFEVKDRVASRMLQHPDVFALDDTAAPQAVAKKSAPQAAMTAPTAEGNSVDPSALSLAPGAKVENPVPVCITLPDGSVKVLEGLDKAALYELAKELGVKVHPASGPVKLIAALQEAFPTKAE